jgi:hypothetical protein
MSNTNLKISLLIFLFLAGLLIKVQSQCLDGITIELEENCSKTITVSDVSNLNPNSYIVYITQQPSPPESNLRGDSTSIADNSKLPIYGVSDWFYGIYEWNKEESCFQLYCWGRFSTINTNQNTMPLNWIALPEDTMINCEDILTFNPGSLSYTGSPNEPCLITGSVNGNIVKNYGECGDTMKVLYSYTDNQGLTITHTRNVFINPIKCYQGNASISIPNIAIGSQTVSTQNQIESQNLFLDSSQVIFFSETSITLLPGFKVQSGVAFFAKIQNCYLDFSITQKPISDISTTKNHKDLIVYPNPSEGQITVDFKNRFGSEFIIQIFSISGSFLETLYKGSEFEKAISIHTDVSKYHTNQIVIVARTKSKAYSQVIYNKN